jgi:hypothetical protein
MANNTATNPIVIDTFSTDVTISAVPIEVKAITFYSAAAGDVFALEDKNGTKVLVIGQTVNGGSMILSPGSPLRFNSLYFDADDTNSGLGSGDYVLIYL